MNGKEIAPFEISRTIMNKYVLYGYVHYFDIADPFHLQNHLCMPREEVLLQGLAGLTLRGDNSSTMELRGDNSTTIYLRREGNHTKLFPALLYIEEDQTSSPTGQPIPYFHSI